MNNITNALKEIYSTGDMRTLVQIREEEQQDVELLVNRTEKVLLQLLSDVEHELMDFRKDRWMAHAEGQNVFYTFSGGSGNGMEIMNSSTYAQIMVDSSGVDIRIMDGQALIESFGLRTNLYAWAKSDQLNTLLAMKFDEFKKDGIKSVEIHMNGFIYRNEK